MSGRLDADQRCDQSGRKVPAELRHGEDVGWIYVGISTKWFSLSRPVQYDGNLVLLQLEFLFFFLLSLGGIWMEHR